MLADQAFYTTARTAQVIYIVHFLVTTLPVDAKKLVQELHIFTGDCLILAFPYISVEHMNMSKCSCPEPCSKIAFEPSQSSALISQSSQAALLGSSLELIKKFREARDTQDLSSKESYVNDLKVVMNITVNYKAMYDYIESNVRTHHSFGSLAKLQSALREFSRMLQHDRDMAFYKAVPELLSSFEKYHLSYRTQLFNSVDEVIRRLFVIAGSKGTARNFTALVPETATLLSQTIEQLTAYDFNLTALKYNNITSGDLPNNVSEIFRCAAYYDRYLKGSHASPFSCKSCVEDIVRNFESHRHALQRNNQVSSTENFIARLRSDEKKMRQCLDVYYDKVLSLQAFANSGAVRMYDDLGSLISDTIDAVDLDELFAHALESQMR